MVREPLAAAQLQVPSQLLAIRGGSAFAPRRFARRLARCAAYLPLRPLAWRRIRSGALSMDTQRLILLFIFGFSVLMLWEAWQKDARPKPAAVVQQEAPTS